MKPPYFPKGLTREEVKSVARELKPWRDWRRAWFRFWIAVRDGFRAAARRVLRIFARHSPEGPPQGHIAPPASLPTREAMLRMRDYGVSTEDVVRSLNAARPARESIEGDGET